MTSSRKTCVLTEALSYQVEFADLHQLLSIQSDLLHVDGDREHRVGATAETRKAAGEQTKEPDEVRKVKVRDEFTWSRRS